MGKFAKQIADIQKKLALQSAETIVGLKQVRAEMELGFARLQETLEAQAQQQHASLDALLDIISAMEKAPPEGGDHRGGERASLERA